MFNYFAPEMQSKKPLPDHRIVLTKGLVTLQQHRPTKTFSVRYGRQVTSDLTYEQAGGFLAAALMHQLTCDGALDASEDLD